MKQPTLSIVICTRNRAHLLEYCLDSFVGQQAKKEGFEVLLIDNASTDNTPQLLKSYLSRYSNFRYFQVPVIGLSHARNRGYQLAKGEWVAYVDDDARVPANFVDRIFWIINNYDFDCFGGIYTAWYPLGKPKWLPSTFGDKVKLRDDIGEIKEGFLSGGIMVSKKEVLERLDGFSTQIGMKQNLGYGEDDEIQIRMRKAGYKIGFDSALCMEHAVLPHKFKLKWHFRAAYAKGRDRAMIFHQGQNFLYALFLLLRSIIGLFLKRIPLAICIWLTRRSYYWQNLVYDVFIPIWYHLGHLEGIMTKKE